MENRKQKQIKENYSNRFKELIGNDKLCGNDSNLLKEEYSSNMEFINGVQEVIDKLNKLLFISDDELDNATITNVISDLEEIL